jgi:eukaryotic-like serine/threonine-protein kinase
MYPAATLALTSGARLGPYEIVAPLGAGGMGEVYRARDGKLNREVAIKVLPVAFAEDVDRLARFRREAQVLAALNHPHIAAIYGLEESSGVEALVLELVEGETLAERLAKGALPVEDALEIARQIAEALEAAHERGIVHRDLKPANVKVNPQGKVKVLDFGLAKALAGDGSSPDVSTSPTLTAAATQAGVVIGTAAYMSPEQARGKSVDKRADIWAFGTVLYEMLTGRRCFEGETVSDTLAAVLMRDPDWSALPAGTPAPVRRVLKRCLDRSPKTRLHDIADARLEMDEAVDPSAAAAAPAAAKLSSRSGLAWAAAAVLALAAAAGWWRALSVPKPVSGVRTAFAVSIPAADTLTYDDTPNLALSRDGRRLVYEAERSGTSHLFLRTFSEIEPRMLEGTAGARDPFFSPDGQWIGFFAEGKLKKSPVGGGPPQTICDGVTAHRGAAWAEDDAIFVSPEYAVGLHRVSSRGGKLEPVTKVEAGKGERTHRWPEVLPGGDAVLFTIGSDKSPGNYDDAKIAIYDRKTGRTRILLEGGSMPRYSPSGHLLYVRSKALLAVPFDLARREITGEPLPLQEKIAGDPSSGIGYFAVGAEGSFAFVPGTTVLVESKLLLADRKGAATELPLPQRSYRFPRFSPDGKKIAFSIGSGRGADDDVWVYEIASGVLTRLTFTNTSFCPVWSRDGRRVAYVSARAKEEGIYARAADGSGTEEWIFGDYTARLHSDWSLDGKTLIFTHPSNEVWLATLNSAGTAATQPDTRAHVFQNHSNAGVYSPDDRWIAYAAPGSAGSVSEIFVQAADGSGGKWQLTTDGGYLPVWVGNEIYSLHGNQVRVTQVETHPAFKAGLPQPLFEGQFELRTAPLRNYDVTRDGKRFVFVRGGTDLGARDVHVVINWARELSVSARPAGKP